MKKAFEVLSGLKATIVGGVFLAASLVLMLAKIELVVDPAWVTVIICGYPLLYLAISRIIYNKGMSKISSALSLLCSIPLPALWCIMWGQCLWY